MMMVMMNPKCERAVNPSSSSYVRNGLTARHAEQSFSNTDQQLRYLLGVERVSRARWCTTKAKELCYGLEFSTRTIFAVLIFRY